MTAPMAPLHRLLRLHEGLRLTPYLDTKGKLTIGVGRNLEDRGITLAEASLLLANDIDDTWQALVRAAPWVADLDEVRQAALVDMGFMGVRTLLGFVQMLAALEAADYDTAAAEALDSKWAEDVGPGRSRRIAEMLRTGEWPVEITA